LSAGFRGKPFDSNLSKFVIAGFIPAIHDLLDAGVIMDGRDKPGHDGGGWFSAR
jgi:hypothetical protein